MVREEHRSSAGSELMVKMSRATEAISVRDKYSEHLIRTFESKALAKL